MKKIWIFTLFCLGLLFRIWLIFHFPQPFGFDQTQYDNYAMGMIGNGLWAHSFRIYGYPLFVASIYLFSGIVSAISKLPWQLIQVFLDTSTALLVYFISKRMFKERVIAVIAYLLYLFNPYTSTFPGVLLPEVLTIFLTTLLFFLLSEFLPSVSIVRLGILGILLGYLSQVRPFYLYFSLIVIGILLALIIKKIIQVKEKLIKIFILLVFFSLPFTYNILGNLKYFGELALMDVDNLVLENFYISLFLERSPDIKLSIWDYPPQVRWAFEFYSYSTDPKDKLARLNKRKIIIEAAKQEILKDPKKFIIWRIKKLWFAWEKHTLYPYMDPKSPFLTTFIYWTNVIILFLCLVGVVSYRGVIKSGNLRLKILFILTLLLFFNTSIVGAATSAQERYSLPAYPMVFIFCAQGIMLIYKKVIKKESYKLSFYTSII